MVVSAEEYRHKIFGVIPSPSHQTLYCETDMAAAASPELKGTLTPPGSSPLRAECDPTQDSSHGSTPPSPEAPPTPDSAHMAAEPTNHSSVRLQSTNDKAERHPLTNEEPLSGAKKRKPTKVHKVELYALRGGRRQ
ncbi:hypothetical protein E2C01_019994 [Portunus trituberculatus]|uniref:Uncharacterized protein n=1 Tax=Portunus trituberculatus TaxID=210409 RepID=A0A5B7E0W8_PORTR|nr:hypothetical protein [Portunus trituberculatus]